MVTTVIPSRADAAIDVPPPATARRLNNQIARAFRGTYGARTGLRTIVRLTTHQMLLAGTPRDAIQRTLEWMQKNGAQAIGDRTPKGFRGEDDLLFVEAVKHSLPMFSPEGVMTERGAAIVRTLLDGSNPKIKSASIDLSRTYTNEFVHGR